MVRVKKRYRIRGWIIWALVLIFIGIAAYINYQLWLSRSDRFVRYKEFGIEIPVNYSIHGIDVSWHQSRVNWDMVKAMEVRGVQLDFVFIKATEGLGRVDVQFRRNWQEVKAAGLTRGAYHFFLATKSGRAQAENFLQTVDLQSGDMLPVLDVEQTYGVKDSVMRARVKEWLDVVENSTGVKPLIYTNVDFYKRHLGSQFDGYPLWTAHYLQHEKPNIDREWSFWQHSEIGRVSGVGTKVDFNVFKGDSLEFRQMLIP